MPQPVYPSNADLQGFLEAHGLTVSTAQQEFLVPLVAAAITEFEQRTGRQFLADTTASARRFDPPTNRNRILFLDDFVELESVSYEPEGATAQTLTAGSDFWIEPANAVAKGKPYTHLRFRRWWAQPLPSYLYQSLVVTARWGYADEIPDDVWQAMLAGAMLNDWSAIMQAATQGILSWTDGGRTINYGVERWTGLKDAWQTQFDRAIARYKKVTL